MSRLRMIPPISPGGGTDRRESTNRTSPSSKAADGHSHRRTSLCAASVLGGARLHGHRRPDARARHRRHDGHLHAHPRGHAALAAGRRSVAPLPHRRRRQLLRAGRPAGSLGDVLVSAVRAAEGRDCRSSRRSTAFQAGGARVSVQAPGRRHDARGRCAPSTSPATTSRRSASARSAAACSPPRTTRRRRRRWSC